MPSTQQLQTFKGNSPSQEGNLTDGNDSDAVRAYGVKGFLKILQSCSQATQVRLLSRVFEVMPERVRQELREVTQLRLIRLRSIFDNAFPLSIFWFFRHFVKILGRYFRSFFTRQERGFLSSSRCEGSNALL